MPEVQTVQKIVLYLYFVLSMKQNSINFLRIVIWKPAEVWKVEYIVSYKHLLSMIVGMNNKNLHTLN